MPDSLPKWMRFLLGAVPGVAWAVFGLTLNISRGRSAGGLAEWMSRIGVTRWPAWLTDERAVAGAGVLVGVFYFWYLRPTHGRIPRIIAVELDVVEMPKWFYLRITVEVFGEPCTFGTEWVADVTKADGSRVIGIRGVSQPTTSPAHSRDRLEVKFPYGDQIPNRAALRRAQFTIRGGDAWGRGVGYP